MALGLAKVAVTWPREAGPPPQEVLQPPKRRRQETPTAPLVAVSTEARAAALIWFCSEEPLGVQGLRSVTPTYSCKRTALSPAQEQQGAQEPADQA